MSNAKRRATIGDDPLDFVISRVSKAESKKPTSGKKSVAPAPTPPSPQKVEKERLTVHVPIDLIERVKNAVFWTPGLTLADFAEGALADAIRRMEAKRGEPYPQRTSQLKGGRPMK